MTPLSVRRATQTSYQLPARQSHLKLSVVRKKAVRMRVSSEVAISVHEESFSVCSAYWKVRPVPRQEVNVTKPGLICDRRSTISIEVLVGDILALSYSRVPQTRGEKPRLANARVGGASVRASC